MIVCYFETLRFGKNMDELCIVGYFSFIDSGRDGEREENVSASDVRGTRAVIAFLFQVVLC